MDISDFTNKDSPKEQKDRKSIGKYTREALKGLENCVSIVEKAAKDNGLTMEEFHRRKVKNVDLLDDLERDKMKVIKTIRESIERPTKATLLQKVISKDRFEGYLKGYNRVGGYVARAQDTNDLNNYDDYYESIRLDYDDSDFSPKTDTSLFVIRFKTDKLSELKVPYSKYLAEEGEFRKEPCTGNGFTAARNGKIVPEYRFDNPVIPSNGAEIHEITKDGREVLRAVFDGKLSKFKSI